MANLKTSTQHMFVGDYYSKRILAKLKPGQHRLHCGALIDVDLRRHRATGRILGIVIGWPLAKHNDFPVTVDVVLHKVRITGAYGYNDLGKVVYCCTDNAEDMTLLRPHGGRPIGQIVAVDIVPYLFDVRVGRIAVVEMEIKGLVPTG